MNQDISNISGAACFILVALKMMFDYLKTKKNGNGHSLVDTIKALDIKMDKLIDKLEGTKRILDLHSARTNECPSALKDLALCLKEISAHQETIAKTLERIELKKVATG